MVVGSRDVGVNHDTLVAWKLAASTVSHAVDEGNFLVKVSC